MFTLFLIIFTILRSIVKRKDFGLLSITLLTTNTLTVSKSYVNIKQGNEELFFFTLLSNQPFLRISCSPYLFAFLLLSLISFSCSVDETNVESKTALHLACEAGFKEIIEILMSFGASVNTTDKDGKTPLELLHLKSMLNDFQKKNSDFVIKQRIVLHLSFSYFSLFFLFFCSCF